MSCSNKLLSIADRHLCVQYLKYLLIHFLDPDRVYFFVVLLLQAIEVIYFNTLFSCYSYRLTVLDHANLIERRLRCHRQSWDVSRVIFDVLDLPHVNSAVIFAACHEVSLLFIHSDSAHRSFMFIQCCYECSLRLEMLNTSFPFTLELLLMIIIDFNCLELIFC